MSQEASQIREYARALQPLTLNPSLDLCIDNVDDLMSACKFSTSELTPPDVAQKMTYSTIESKTIASQAARIEEQPVLSQHPVSICLAAAKPMHLEPPSTCFMWLAGF